MDVVDILVQAGADVNEASTMVSRDDPVIYCHIS